MSDEALKFARAFLAGDVMQRDVRSAPATGHEKSSIVEQLTLAAENPDTNDFDLLIALVEEFRKKGQRLPDWLADFAADAATGKIKRPTKRGPDTYKNWERDYTLFRCVTEVSLKFLIPKYINSDQGEGLPGSGTTMKPTAAAIVSQASGISADVVITAYKRFSRLGVD